MKKAFKKIIQHPLISGSAIIFIGSFVTNVANYFFALYMGRLLSVENYSILVSLISVIGLIAILQGTLSTIFAKFTAMYVASNNHDMLASVISTGWKITIGIVVILCVVFLALYKPIEEFLHISNFLLIVLTIAGFATAILSSVYIGVFQGELRFRLVAFFSIIGSGVKLGLGILLVILGYSVAGALFGIVGMFTVSLLLALPFLAVGRAKKSVGFEKKFLIEFKKYSLPFFLATLGIAFMQSADVILIRHLTTAVMSGQYAALSLMGKAIFYLTMPIYFVFFPLIAQKNEKKEKVTGTLILALCIVFCASLAATSFYFLFPGVVLRVFYPKPEYKILTSYIGWYGLYISIFSIGYLLTNFFLSVGKTGVWKITALTAVVFSVILWFYHDTFVNILTSLFISVFLLLAVLCIYYTRHEK